MTQFSKGPQAINILADLTLTLTLTWAYVNLVCWRPLPPLRRPQMFWKVCLRRSPFQTWYADKYSLTWETGPGI